MRNTAHSTELGIEGKKGKGRGSSLKEKWLVPETDISTKYKIHGHLEKLATTWKHSNSMQHKFTRSSRHLNPWKFTQPLYPL